MARPRIPIGTSGQPRYSTLPSGKVRARADFRDVDGVTRTVSAVGVTQDAAYRALQVRLRDRQRTAAAGTLTGDSTIRQLAETWLASDRVTDVSRPIYASAVRRQVIPHVGSLRLSEMTTPAVAAFLDRLGAKIGPKGKPLKTDLARTCLSSMMSYAVERGFIPGPNPVHGLMRRRRNTPNPITLTTADLTKLRSAFDRWESGELTGHPHDKSLRHWFEVSLATGIRIGEALGLRFADVDFAVTPVRITVCGTIKPDGSRQPWPKDHEARTVAVPEWAAAILLERRISAEPGDIAVFPAARGGKFRTPANVRRDFRVVREAAGVDERVTPHVLRKTMASAVAVGGSLDIAAAVLGHSSPRITREHYVAGATVTPDATAHLAHLAPPPSGDSD